MKKLFILFAFISLKTFSQSFLISPTEMQKTQNNGTNADISLTRFGINPMIVGRFANGSISAPSAVLKGNHLLFIGCRGYNGTSFASSSAFIRFEASENWNTNARGAKIVFGTAQNGTNSILERMTINDEGNVGIGIDSPLSRFHITAGSSGVTPNSDPAVFIEDNRNTYLNLAAPNTNETGILFGRPDDTGTSGGIIYRANKDMQLRTKGNTTRMTIASDGDVGIGTTIPSAKLDVNGNAKIGTNGTVISEIIKVTVSVPAFTIGANSCENQDISITNAAVDSAVMASPEIGIRDGLFIAYARVSSAGIVRVRICNFTGASITQSTSDFHVAVVR